VRSSGFYACLKSQTSAHLIKPLRKPYITQNLLIIFKFSSTYNLVLYEVSDLHSRYARKLLFTDDTKCVIWLAGCAGNPSSYKI